MRTAWRRLAVLSVMVVVGGPAASAGAPAPAGSAEPSGRDLIDAVRQGDAAAVESLLAAAVDVTATGGTGRPRSSG